MIQFRSLSLVCFLIVIVSGPATTRAQTLEHREGDNTVKIGLLIPDKESLAARQGAELAIRKANERGGTQTFQLVVRSTEGPWGAGSKESVSMVFDDGVVAIMGSLDGRNAHLAEQVATKTRIAFLSSWATDMTLSQAFVPWYFRCIPNDHQQATSLIREIYQKRKLTKLAIITWDAYDSRHAAGTFIKVMSSKSLAEPKQFIYGSSDRNLPEILSTIEEHGAEAIVLFGEPEFASEIMPMLKQRGMNQMIFGTLAVTDGQKTKDPDWSCLEGSVLVSSGHWFTDEGMAFQEEFQNTFGYQPGAAAAYAYDGINVIIGVVRRAGMDRDRIIEAFAEANHPSGITGNIQFDVNGNRSGSASLMTIREGNPFILEED